MQLLFRVQPSSHTILLLQRSSIMKFLSEILPFHSLLPTLLCNRWQDTFSTLWVVVGCDKAKGQFTSTMCVSDKIADKHRLNGFSHTKLTISIQCSERRKNAFYKNLSLNETCKERGEKRWKESLPSIHAFNLRCCMKRTCRWRRWWGRVWVEWADVSFHISLMCLDRASCYL